MVEAAGIDGNSVPVAQAFFGAMTMFEGMRLRYGLLAMGLYLGPQIVSAGAPCC